MPVAAWTIRPQRRPPITVVAWDPWTSPRLVATAARATDKAIYPSLKFRRSTTGSQAAACGWLLRRRQVIRRRVIDHFDLAISINNRWTSGRRGVQYPLSMGFWPRRTPTSSGSIHSGRIALLSDRRAPNNVGTTNRGQSNSGELRLDRRLARGARGTTTLSTVIQDCRGRAWLGRRHVQ